MSKILNLRVMWNVFVRLVVVVGISIPYTYLQYAMYVAVGWIFIQGVLALTETMFQIVLKKGYGVNRFFGLAMDGCLALWLFLHDHDLLAQGVAFTAVAVMLMKERVRLAIIDDQIREELQRLSNKFRDELLEGLKKIEGKHE